MSTQVSDSGSPTLPIQVDLIPEDQPNRSGMPFQANDLFITVHETNNPNSDGLAEGAFFRSGGGPRRAASHFVVDQDRAVQLLPLDEQGKHSDDGGPGDTTSVAISACVATSMDFAKVRRNLAQLIARVTAGDEALDWGRGATRGRFSIERVRQHHDWAPANPCPRHIRNEDFWPTLLAWVRDAAGQGRAAASGN